MDGYDGDGLDRALGSFSIFIMIWAFFIIKKERERGWNSSPPFM
jgi:hypothetical protein